MSRMVEICMDIEQMYFDGASPKQIAHTLGCSVEFVQTVIEDVDQYTEDHPLQGAPWSN